MGIGKSPAVKFPLRTTLVLPFVLQIALAVGAVTYLSFRSGQRAVSDLSTQLRSEITARIDSELNKYLNSPHDFNRLNGAAFAEGSFDLVNASNAKQFLTQVQISPFIYSSYCGDAQGQYLGAYRLFYQGSSTIAMSVSNEATSRDFYFYAMDNRGNRQQVLQKLRPYDPRKRPWYIAAVNERRPVWSEVYLDFASGLPTITASEPVYNPQGDILGVCATDVVLLEDLRKFLASLSIGKTGQAFIIDRSGSMLSSSTKEPLTTGQGENSKLVIATQSEEPLVRETAQYLQRQFGSFDQIERSQQLDYNLNGQRQLVQISPLNDGRGINWLIVVVVPEADFMEQIDANTKNTILLTLAALMIAILLGMRTSHWIARPLLRLAEASRSIAQGNLDQQVEETSTIAEVATLSQSFNGMSRQLKDSVEALHLANEELEARVERRTGELRKEKERSEQLLLNILPAEIADRLMRTNESPAEHFEEATILFADIVGFTSLSARMEPLQLVAGLNQIFSAFDQLTEKYGLEKIKTIGDAYMVVGGLPVSRPDHAEAIANMALDMQAYMQNMDNVFGESLQIRIGINTGSVIAGVIGIKKFIYDLWGDVVNVASRMESHGKPGYIQVTEATYKRLQDKYFFESRGTIEVKGRGEMMTYWLIGRR
ncbi:MAG: HAMP domain-containing protein [Coleofasciculaceae cyanobacterium SM2_1_6]|nr:HAMP domain-containing protein [Coleofasciculaceae cyanobacterium SM2_1_6]